MSAPGVGDVWLEYMPRTNELLVLVETLQREIADEASSRLKVVAQLCEKANVPAWMAHFEPDDQTYVLIPLHRTEEDPLPDERFPLLSEADCVRLLYRLRGFVEPPADLFEKLKAAPARLNYSSRHRL